MDSKGLLESVLSGLFIFILLAVTSGRELTYHEPAGRKLASDYTGFISIDCGAAEDYEDEATGIPYVTDKSFINTGSTTVISVTPANYQLKHLRYFPDQGTNNCYTLKPVHGKNNKYLIRALFQYGNYDGKNNYPKFDLYLGVNKWETIQAAYSSKFIWTEVIHVPLANYINVCLVNIGHGVPFISALELRFLNNSVYEIGTESLVSLRRKSVGRSSSIDVKRYKEDVYDRFWRSVNLPDPELPTWDLITTTSFIDTQSSNDAYKLPAKVLTSAGQSQNQSSPLNYTLNNIDTDDSVNTKYYVYLHFAEIDKLGVNQLREIYISSDDVILEKPFTLDYLRPLTTGPYNLPIKGDSLSFSIHATAKSDLPPILNAFEIFKTLVLPFSQTDPEDVNAIMDMKQKYEVPGNWQGDPCIPSNTSWKGLNCSKDNPPRIISLNLSFSRLTGEIPTSLSNLQALKSLDLSYNKLTGPVLESLEELPFLEVLNLRGNNLTGSVPLALRDKAKKGTLFLSLDSNPHLCQSDSCNGSRHNKLTVALAALITPVVALIIAVAVIWSLKGRIQREIGSSGEKSLKQTSQQFAYSEILIITDDLSNVIGEGGFGKVYHGILQDNTQVAVKLLSTLSRQGFNEFETETKLLMRVHHKNLVSLIGYCDEGKNTALIYEYMANGNLQQHLSGTQKNTIVLNWKERIQIAIDTARGMEYLHNDCKPPIIHRDLKTSNILLNESMQAKIADFGLCRVLETENDSHLVTEPAGTWGYVDPEYYSSRKLNKKSDVYSFGIVLLELITGQPAVNRAALEYIHIIQWVSPMIARCDIRSIVDPKLQGNYNINSAWKALETAMACVPQTAIKRPEMSYILAELKECLEIESAFERTRTMKSYVTLQTDPFDMSHVMILDSERAPSCRHVAEGDPLVAKAQALLLAISSAASLGFSKTVFEVGCLLALEPLLDWSRKPAWSIASVISEAKGLLQSSFFCNWAFSKVPWLANGLAHSLAQWAFSSKVVGPVSFSQIPPFVVEESVRLV